MSQQTSSDYAAAEEEFNRVKGIIKKHCEEQKNTLEQLVAQLKKETPSNFNEELKTCIGLYDEAMKVTERANFAPPSTLKTTLQTVGSAAGIVGLMLLGPASVGVACGLMAGGAAAGGAAPVIDKIQNKLSKNSLLKPIVNADRQAERFLSKHKDKLLVNQNDIATKFKTESANFKKRMALYALGALHLAAAAIILAASHGALAPVALKVTMMGAKHISAGMATGAAVSKIAIGAGAIGLAHKKVPDRRSDNLTNKLSSEQSHPPK